MELGVAVLWVVVFLALGVAALPLAAWLLPGTEPAGFAIPLALAVLGVVGHLVGHVAFGWPALLAGLAVLVVLSGVAYSRVGVPGGAPREYALVFVAGYLLIVLIRGIDPAAAPLPLSAGEKFLDFGLLNALDRSESLPPESMWFAGEPVQYYYGGQLVVSLLATLTGTSTAHAYNLGLAGFYATLVTAAYGLAAAIARSHGVSRRVAGAFGAFFVGLAGTLDTAIRLLAWLLPDSLAEALVTRAGMDADTAAWSPGEFWYWEASRVIPVEPQGSEAELRAATEFPLFAWLNGDLHAHMLSQPFVLLVAALLLAAWRAPVGHRRVLLFGVLPPLAGLVGLVNFWSFPTVLGITALAVFFDDGLELLPGRLRERAIPVVSRPLHDELSRLLAAVLTVAVVAVGAVLWTLPFWTSVILETPGQSVAYWEQSTPLGPLVVVFGGFLAAIAAYLARGFWALDARLRPGLVLAGGALVVAVAGAVGWSVGAVALAVVLAGWLLLRAGAVGFETVLVVAGAGLVLVVELLTLEGERFNVIFKPSVDVWLFWAVATAVALPRLAAGWPSTAGVSPRLRRTGTVLAAVLVLATVPYAGFALHDHVTSGTETTDELGTTLDATAYLEVHYPEEAPAIRWLDDLAGQPTTVTAAPAGYVWNGTAGEGSAAPASLTGVPTVAGWTHEAQYRGDEPYDERVADVHAIYGGDPAEQRTLLGEYGVEYVYVGPAERNSPYFEVTVDELDAVTVAASWESVTIYEVDQDRLSGRLRSSERSEPCP